MCNVSDETLSDIQELVSKYAQIVDCVFKEFKVPASNEFKGGKEIDLLKEVITGNELANRGDEFMNYFSAMPRLCKEVTKLSFKIRKADVYDKTPGQVKLSKLFPKVMDLVEKAGDIASFHQRQAMRSVTEACQNLVAGLEKHAAMEEEARTAQEAGA